MEVLIAYEKEKQTKTYTPINSTTKKTKCQNRAIPLKPLQFFYILRNSN
jgi:hypothetical protein